MIIDEKKISHRAAGLDLFRVVAAVMVLPAGMEERLNAFEAVPSCPPLTAEIEKSSILTVSFGIHPSSYSPTYFSPMPVRVAIHTHSSS